MDIKALEKSLSPWLRLNTWHTKHPEDEERFHHALRVVVQRYPGHEIFRANDIERYARRAEIIGYYLFDVRNCQ